MLSDETRAALEEISVATVSMQLLKRGIRNVSMLGPKPLGPGTPRIIGPAFTLRFVPWREDRATPEVLGDAGYSPRQAVEEAPADSVLVIDGRGRGDIAVIGDLLAMRLKIRGLAGIVTDGGIRDADAVLGVGFPVYAAGPAAPAHIAGHAAADHGTPCACGGVAVFPGDIVMADGDGAVVIPAHLADEIARDGPEQERYERFALEKIREGRPVPGVYPPNEATRAEYEGWSEDDG